jgi:3-dehydroquinate dehydratase-2
VTSSRNRVDIIHGVNLNMLGRRPVEHYGPLTFDQLEQRITEFAHELDLEPRFFQTNHEGELVEHLHRVEGLADAIVINPGAWTHYAWAIRDALEIASLPAVEVHLSDVDAREEFRRVSVIRDLCLTTVKGQGADGYRTALTRLKQELGL